MRLLIDIYKASLSFNLAGSDLRARTVLLFDFNNVMVNTIVNQEVSSLFGGFWDLRN